MKTRGRLSSGNLLLLELIFAIFFFCLSVAVTVSVFGKAFSMSRNAYSGNKAVAEAKSVAEIIRSVETVAEAEKYLLEKGLYPNADGDYELLYGDGRYRLVLSATLDGNLYTGEIICTVVSSGEDIYKLTVSHWMKGVAIGG
ncbi:MAG: hypothetical protein J6O55_00220 [Lachnospiraceae bacterium]|nr:hypothetical protein [Lachnospiraceae bacterium]